MKFVFGREEAFKSRLANIPWANAFLPSKILVVGLDDRSNEVMAACGIRSVFNPLTLYVSEQRRGFGIGNQILKKVVDKARECSLRFILLEARYDNARAFHLYSKFGFRKVVLLRKIGLKIIMLPVSFLDEVSYWFLYNATLLQDLFWTYVAHWIHDRTISCHVGD